MAEEPVAGVLSKVDGNIAPYQAKQKDQNESSFWL